MKAIELNENETDFNYNLGLLYLSQKRYDEALKYFNKVMEFDKNDANTHFNFGQIYLNLGTFDKAINSFKRHFR
ncbi:MAG: tetratricopeptide repeat protein [Candidatus Melainabacteria bacterium]|nr:MAG: tetratricopeptide repeat protein [Candidatus Melainabacteria bacterium]